jgi:hypothetical protein
MAAFVMPCILAYREETPTVWDLLVLPAYMCKARRASQGHGLTDLISGAEDPRRRVLSQVGQSRCFHWTRAILRTCSRRY